MHKECNVTLRGDPVCLPTVRLLSDYLVLALPFAAQCTWCTDHSTATPTTSSRTHARTENSNTRVFPNAVTNLDLNWIEEQTIRRRLTILMLVIADGPVND